MPLLVDRIAVAGRLFLADEMLVSTPTSAMPRCRDRHAVLAGCEARGEEQAELVGLALGSGPGGHLFEGDGRGGNRRLAGVANQPLDKARNLVADISGTWTSLAQLWPSGSGVKTHVPTM